MDRTSYRSWTFERCFLLWWPAERVTKDIFGQESCEVKWNFTFYKSDESTSKELRNNISNSGATFLIKNLFVAYHSILGRHGLFWTVKDNQMVAVYHVLSAARPEHLQARFETDLGFSHHDLQKEFKNSVTQARKLSGTFQLIYNGSPNFSGSRLIMLENPRNFVKVVITTSSVSSLLTPLSPTAACSYVFLVAMRPTVFVIYFVIALVFGGRK